MKPEGIEGSRLSTISEVIWYLLSFNIAWRWLKQLDFQMLPPDVWVKEKGRSILSKDSFPSSSDQCQAAAEQKQSISVLWMNEWMCCSWGKGTGFSSGHIYFLSSDARIHDSVKHKAERIQLESYAVLNWVVSSSWRKSPWICKACKKVIADFPIDIEM